MPEEIVTVGYICPLCGNRVLVLQSSDPPPDLPREILSECQCGFLRKIPISGVQYLDVWKQKKTG